MAICKNLNIRMNDTMSNSTTLNSVEKSIGKEEAVDIDDFMAQNSEVKMISPVVLKSCNEEIGIIRANSQTQKAMEQDKAVTPFEYMQGGNSMIFPEVSSHNYILNRDTISQNMNQISLPARNIGEFYYDESAGILYFKSIAFRNVQPIRIANFDVKIIGHYNLISRLKSKEMVVVAVRNLQSHVELHIPLEKLSDFYKILSEGHPEFFLYPDNGKAHQILKQYIAEVYGYSKNYIFHGIKYEQAGWNFDALNHRWHYYSGIDADCLSEMKLANGLTMYPQDLIYWNAGLLEIGLLEIMLPLFIHMHLGFTLKLFEEAGYNEQYILMLVGESGSKKTSLSRELFCLFDGRIINFQATDRAIELEMINRQDSTMVLDDLTSGSDANLTNKFEKILRQLGDSTGRVRSINGGMEQDTVPTRCAVVLTSETDIDALSKSSKLRTLAIYIGKNSLNSEKLSQYQMDAIASKNQKHFSRLEQYITLYVRFLEMQYPLIVENLKMAKMAPIKEEFTFARQATISKILKCQAILILRFWFIYGFITFEKVDTIFRKWVEVLDTVIRENEMRGRTVDSYLLFLQVINYALKNGKISWGKNGYYSDHIGYKEKTYLVLNFEASYDYVSDFYRRKGKLFTESKRILLNKLYERGLIDVYEQKNHKPKMLKKVKIDGIGQPMLWLKWNMVEQELNAISENEF